MLVLIPKPQLGGEKIKITNEKMANPVFLTFFAQQPDGKFLPALADEERAIGENLLNFSDIEHVRQEQVKIQDFGEYCKKEKIQRTVLFHFSGHTSSDSIETSTGRINPSAVAGYSQNNLPNLRVIFLNGCANFEQVEAFFKVNSVKAIIATKCSVNDTYAKNFSNEFYKALSKPNSHIEYAYKEAINKINENRNQSNTIQPNVVTRGALETEINEDSWVLVHKEEDESFLKDLNWWKIENSEYSLILSNESNKDKLKIFCLYDEKSKGIYDGIRSALIEVDDDAEIKQERVQNGLFNIFQDKIEKIDDAISSRFSKALEEEIKAANCILHFVNGSDYINLIDDNKLGVLLEKYVKKQHLFLPIQRIGESLKKYTWYKNESNLNRWTSINELSNKDYRSAYNEAFKENFEEKLKPDTTLLKTIEEIPFSQIVDYKDFKDSQNIYFSHIQCTDACGEAILIRSLRKHAKIRIADTAITHIVPCEKLLIEDEKELWKKLYQLLKTGLEPGITDKNRNVKCVEKLLSSLANNDTVVIFNRVYSKEIYDSIVSNLLNEIIKSFPEYREAYREEQISLGKTDEEETALNHKLYIFVISRESFESANIPTTDAFSSVISFIPIEPFSDRDYTIWNPQEKLKSIPKLSSEINRLCKEYNRRKDLIGKIIETSSYSYLLNSIEQKYLTLK